MAKHVWTAPRLQGRGGRFFGYAFACAHVSGLLVQRGLLAKMVCAAGDPNNPATSIGRCFARFISCCGSNDPVHLSASRARSARRVQTMSERADLVRRPLAQEPWRRMRSARRSPSASRRSAPFCWRAPPPRAWRACAPTDMGGEGAAVGGVIEREHASSRVDGAPHAPRPRYNATMRPCRSSSLITRSARASGESLTESRVSSGASGVS